MQTKRNRIAGVILAAGRSRRMGRPKQLLPWHGRPLLQYVIEQALSSQLNEVVVVLGAASDLVRDVITLGEGPELRFVTNPHWAEGQSTSLQAGIHALGKKADAAAILLGDQPGVGSNLIDRVIDAFANSEATAFRPVYESADGVISPGHPVILYRSHWPLLDSLSGDQGARHLLQREIAIEEVILTSPPPTDLDTMGGYRNAIAKHSRT